MDVSQYFQIEKKLRFYLLEKIAYFRKPFPITCYEIINNKNLKKTIKEKTEDLWSNRKGKEDLIIKLDKLLKLSKSVFFVIDMLRHSCRSK